MVSERVRSAAILFILLAFLCAQACGAENKTAYTRDGVHFVSKERMEENILYEYAQPGDYRSVQVPLDTIVVGASVIPEWLEEEEEEEEQGGTENETEEMDESPDTEENFSKYPYAAIGVGLLLILGLIALAAWARSRKSRRGRRKLKRR